jgi:hypothetical protein
MKNTLAIFLFFLISIFNVHAQETPSTEKKAKPKDVLSAEEQYQKEYNKRIKRERLFGVYIPKDLPDAYTQLNRLTPIEAKAKFKRVEEEIAAKKLHFSLGRWIIHNWGFYGGSRLSHYIKKMGLSHPDDQAQLIIRTYHRYLNKKPLDIKKTAEDLQEARIKKLEERKKKGKVISKEKRKKDN